MVVGGELTPGGGEAGVGLAVMVDGGAAVPLVVIRVVVGVDRGGAGRRVGEGDTDSVVVGVDGTRHVVNGPMQRRLCRRPRRQARRVRLPLRHHRFVSSARYLLISPSPFPFFVVVVGDSEEEEGRERFKCLMAPDLEGFDFDSRDSKYLVNRFFFSAKVRAIRGFQCGAESRTQFGAPHVTPFMVEEMRGPSVTA